MPDCKHCWAIHRPQMDCWHELKLRCSPSKLKGLWLMLLAILNFHACFFGQFIGLVAALGCLVLSVLGFPDTSLAFPKVLQNNKSLVSRVLEVPSKKSTPSALQMESSLWNLRLWNHRVKWVKWVWKDALTNSGFHGFPLLMSPWETGEHPPPSTMKRPQTFKKKKNAWLFFTPCNSHQMGDISSTSIHLPSHLPTNLSLALCQILAFTSTFKRFLLTGGRWGFGRWGISRKQASTCALASPLRRCAFLKQRIWKPESVASYWFF